MSKYKCTKCGDTLESKHRHDFVTCQCGNFVDGGDVYLRMGGTKEGSNPLDLVKVEE